MPLLEDASKSIVAGRMIDLSGLACYHPDCLRKDVDRLFSRVWHHFDKIVVVGLTPEYVNRLLENLDDNARDRFLGFVDNFLYIRRIGAEGMLAFRQKPSPCTYHLEQHASEAGVSSLLEQRQPWREQFAMAGESGT